MVVREDALEHQLLLLGREELAIEQNLQRLRIAGREAAMEGRPDEADAIWDLFETLRSKLPALQAEITQVERELYGLRRRRS